MTASAPVLPSLALIGAAAFAGAGDATAQQVTDCFGAMIANATTPEPYDAHTRTFANGAVRLTVVDAGGPEAANFHLLVLSPPYSEGEAQCRAISRTDTEGWANLQFSDLSAAYDPATGLSFDLPATIVLPEAGFQNSTLLTITVNQATGDVAVSQQLGRE
ncbi:hypothetical protein [Flavimaricola marinus]|uniref:Uncharacterized protein n=1 Tax=Flavimaricola marinus TaxID=1819565 RepID=A0A238LC00_9RHOB|nr:hypothetical protein [Flavimaricola marinus]SMY06476.1 hypothetical protein LOM8899_00601 [Flavimaricola marinus]